MLAQQQQQALINAYAVYGGGGAGGVAGALGAVPNLPSKEPLENAGISVGEIVGWRIWRIVGGYLQSFSADRTWAPDEPMSGAPTDYGPEGVWAFKERSRALHKALKTSRSAWGAVALWGEVIEHELGYRAEFARIISLEDALLGRLSRWRSYRTLRRLRQRYTVGRYLEE